jgi:hypothetical protein
MKGDPVATSLGIIYREVLASPHASPEHQRLSLNWGLANSDWGLLVALLGLPNLDAEVDNQLAKISNAAVLAAYIARPGRSCDDLSRMALTDKRAAVHKVLAGTPGLSSAAYTALADTSSRAVALVLLFNEDASLAARQKAARVASSHLNHASNNECALWTEAFVKYPDLRDDMVIGCCSQPVAIHQSPKVFAQYRENHNNGIASLNDLGTEALHCFSTKLSEHLSEVCRVAQAGPTNNASMTYWYNLLLLSAYYLAMVSTLDENDRQELLSVLKKSRALMKTTTTKGAITTSDVIALLNDPPHLRSGVITKLTVEKAQSLSDLEQIVEIFDPGQLDAAAIATCVLGHRLTSPALAKKLLERTSKLHQVSFKKAFEVHGDDPEFVTQLGLVRYSEITPERLRRSGDATGVVRTLAAQATKVTLRALIPVLDISNIGAAPSTFLDTVGSSVNGGGPIGALIVERLLEGLGTDPRSWELFEDLAPHAYGTIDDLISQVSILRQLED